MSPKVKIQGSTVGIQSRGGTSYISTARTRNGSPDLIGYDAPIGPSAGSLQVTGGTGDPIQRATMSTPDALRFTTSSFTVELWARVTSFPVAENYAFACVDGPTSDYHYYLGWSRSAGGAASDWKMYLGTIAGQRNLSGGAKPDSYVTINEWFHLACSVDLVTNPNFASASFYFNGTAWGTDVVDSGGGLSTGGTIFNVGARGSTSSGQSRGNIDEVRIWNGTRSQAQIDDNKSLILTPADHPDLFAYFRFGDLYDEVKDYGPLTLTGGASLSTDDAF